MSTKAVAASLGFVRKRLIDPAAKDRPVASNRATGVVNHTGAAATKYTHQSSDQVLEASVRRIPSGKQFGQCTVCRRMIGLTQAGFIFKHGQNCPGGGKLPAQGSVSSSRVALPIVVSSSPASSSDAVSPLPASASASSIIELLLKRRCRVLKRIPKASRIPAAEKLALTLRRVTADPDSVDRWNELFIFASECFAVPGQRGGRQHKGTLATKVNAAIASFPSALPTVQPKPKSKFRPSTDNLAARVSAKLEDGDVRGAIRLVASDDTMAPFDDITAASLQAKHPPRAVSKTPPPTPSADLPCLCLQEPDIMSAIRSFVPGSAGGPDGLRPQHLKDLTSASAGDAGRRLLTQLTEFANICLIGRVPDVIQPVLCGASLCALNKKDGGVRPIAIGFTLRRLVCKAACKAVMSRMASRFQPVQVGFGVPGATEAAAHAARAYVAGLQPGQGMLKLDFINAFNAVSRDEVLRVVHDELPELYTFVHMCYAGSSLLNFGEHQLRSDEGLQQGDPLAPLLFCASTMKLSRSMTSEFNVWYLDDGTIGGDVSDLLLDLETVRTAGRKIGLLLNDGKCEIVTDDANVVTQIRAVLPAIHHVPCNESILLGAPIGDETSVDAVLNTKLVTFRLLTSRLASLSAHDALYLLKNCFSMPKLIYTLRCAACYKSTVLNEYDANIHSTLQVILNIDLSEAAWSQATLPVASGGLGVRLATDLALPAFLASVNGAANLTLQLLPSRMHAVSGNLDPISVAACIEWQSRCNTAVPDSARAGIQKAWDMPIVSRKSEQVMSAADTQVGRARLIAAAAPHSGDFLHALPCSSVGTRLDDTSLRIAVALRLGAPVCAPHTCVCGEPVDSSGLHGLACRKSAGRHIRHNAVNDLIKRALASADIPAMLEPSSLSRDDGKRPDGLTVMPWSNGRCLVWDFTCPHTLAASHLNKAVLGPGAVANDAESRKSSKYRSLAALYSLTPIAVESLGPLGQDATIFFNELGRRIEATTAEPRSLQFLFQRLSVTVQRGNAACVIGTVPSSGGLDDLF